MRHVLLLAAAATAATSPPDSRTTCSLNGGSPSLDGYQVGNHVKATCVNGTLTATEHR